MEHKDGGPAFPVPNDANMNDQMGMSLRDYFAAKALPAVMARITQEEANRAALRLHMRENDMYAAEAYEIADAMLAWREGAGHDH